MNKLNTLLIIVYVLIKQETGIAPTLVTYQGLSKSSVEKMLKEQKLNYTIISKSEYDAFMKKHPAKGLHGSTK